MNLGQPAAAKGWVGLAVGVGAAVLLLVGLSRRWPGCAPAAIGVAAGITAGASSVLLAIGAGRIEDPRALFMTIVPYAAVALGLLTLMLSQGAFQTGPIGTPLAALSVTEPLAAAFLAVTMLHERLPSSALLILTTGLGATAAVAGVLVLSRSATLERSLGPLTTAEHDRRRCRSRAAAHLRRSRSGGAHLGAAHSGVVDRDHCRPRDASEIPAAERCRRQRPHHRHPDQPPARSVGAVGTGDAGRVVDEPAQHTFKGITHDGSVVAQSGLGASRWCRRGRGR